MRALQTRNETTMSGMFLASPRKGHVCTAAISIHRTKCSQQYQLNPATIGKRIHRRDSVRKRGTSNPVWPIYAGNETRLPTRAGRAGQPVAGFYANARVCHKSFLGKAHGTSGRQHTSTPTSAAAIGGCDEPQQAPRVPLGRGFIRSCYARTQDE